MGVECSERGCHEDGTHYLRVSIPRYEKDDPLNIVMGVLLCERHSLNRTIQRRLWTSAIGSPERALNMVEETMFPDTPLMDELVFASRLRGDEHWQDYLRTVTELRASRK